MSKPTLDKKLACFFFGHKKLYITPIKTHDLMSIHQSFWHENVLADKVVATVNVCARCRTLYLEDATS